MIANLRSKLMTLQLQTNLVTPNSHEELKFTHLLGKPRKNRHHRWEEIRLAQMFDRTSRCGNSCVGKPLMDQRDNLKKKEKQINFT